MGLERMRAAMARALTEPAFLARLLAREPGAVREAGLTPHEAAQLATLDPARLAVVSEGYVAKRLEPLESALPRTMRFLSRRWPAAVPAAVAAAASGRSARQAMEAALASTSAPMGACRLAEDLADLDALLAASPGQGLPPPHRFVPDALRVGPGPFLLRLSCRGALWKAFPAALDGEGTPPDYPASPCECLAVPDGATVQLVPVEGTARALVAACDGTRTVAEVVGALGPACEATLRLWLDRGVLAGRLDP